jgi:hypothetical protein
MLKEKFIREVAEKLDSERVCCASNDGAGVFIIKLNEKSDYDIVCEINGDTGKLKAVLKGMDQEKEIWKMNFNSQDYRNTEYFYEHFIGVAKKLILSNSKIIVSKGLIFVHFQAFSLLKDDKAEKISSYYSGRWKCKIPFVKGKSSAFDGLVF